MYIYTYIYIFIFICDFLGGDIFSIGTGGFSRLSLISEPSSSGLAPSIPSQMEIGWRERYLSLLPYF